MSVIVLSEATAANRSGGILPCGADVLVGRGSWVGDRETVTE